jgi:hypothetical protein
MASSASTSETTPVLRPFVITTYCPDISGVPVPVLPVQCIACLGASVGACDLGVNHRRSRKTGPCFALTVMRCTTHGVAFTLYPQGHVPYGRVAIAPISSTALAGTTGDLLFSADDSPLVVAAASTRRSLDWRVTVFEAALEAADARAWSRAGLTSLPNRWRTQGRRIALCASILGLLSVPEERVGTAAALAIAPLALSDVARSFVAATGFRARGQAVCNALDLLTISRCLGDKLLIAGARSHCWGAPVRCDSQSGRLLALSDAARAPP